MKRTQIQLDEATYELLRQRAHERHVSMAGVVREAIGEYLAGARRPRRTLADFKFIGIAAAEPPGSGTVSENHDEAWGDLLYEEINEKAVELRQREPPKAQR